MSPINEGGFMDVLCIGANRAQSRLAQDLFISPLSSERRALARELVRVPSFTRHQIVLRDHTALFLMLSHFSSRSGSASMIAGRCDRAGRALNI